MKTALLMIALQLASSGADAYTTRWGQQHGWREDNPIARRLVGTDKGTAVFFGGTAAWNLGTAHLLRHFHHRKLARVWEAGGIATNAEGAAWNLAHGDLERGK